MRMDAARANTVDVMWHRQTSVLRSVQGPEDEARKEIISSDVVMLSSVIIVLLGLQQG